MKLLPSTFLLLLAPLAAFAQVPDSGSMLQQVRPPSIAVPPSTGPGLRIERKNELSLPAGEPFRVTTIRISGNTRFDTATLQALVADADGQILTLPQLWERAARLSEYYHRRGYPLVQAVIPAQEIQGGVVVIEIIEARYGAIRLENQSTVRDSLVHATLSPLAAGQEIEQTALDHPLLLLSDVPGLTVNATLQPGEQAGTADLVVRLPAADAVTGSLVVDNYGNRYTGRFRGGLNVNFNNPLGNGDVLSLSGLSSGSGLNYGRVAYESIVCGAGTRVGGSYSALHYILGDTFDDLDAHGTANVFSGWVKHPFLRTRAVNLYGQLQYDQLDLRDHIEVAGIHADRHLDNWTASMAGDERDTHGLTVWRVDLTNGRVGFDDGVAEIVDAITAGTSGGFTKVAVNAGRLQKLSPTDAIYLAFMGQWGSTNLDSSQKMIAGGPYSVRAYDIGAVSGDIGAFGSAEFRHDLGAALSSQWQAVAFIESAYVQINESPWLAGKNHATLNGMGVGLNWGGPSLWNGKASVAIPLGPNPSMAAERASVRFWVEISRAF
jgi:hemolysin activation/secretion protein